MANVPDIGGDASSNIVVGAGTDTVTYRLPDTPGQKVTSVVATVNNGAASGVTPKIVIRDSSGQVIATNTQTDSIPAADTGTATFALRLADKGGGGIKFNKDPQSGGFLFVETTGSDPTTGDGIDLIAANQVTVHSDSFIFLETTDAGSAITADAAQDVSLIAGRDVNATASRQVDVLAPAFNITANGTNGTITTANTLTLDATGAIVVNGASDEFHTVTGDILLNAGGQIDVDGELAQHGGNLGFFGVTPVSQQPTPVVLADVIALLQAYGLSA